jgi:hypothetical protein
LCTCFHVWFLACACAGGPAGPASLTALILYGRTACIPIPTRAVRAHSLYTEHAGSMCLGVARWQASHGGCAMASASVAVCCSGAAYGDTSPCAMLPGVVVHGRTVPYYGDWCGGVADLAAAVRSGTVLLWLRRRQLVYLQLLAFGVQLSPHGSLVAALHCCMVASVCAQSYLDCWSCAGYYRNGRNLCCGLLAPWMCATRMEY